MPISEIQDAVDRLVRDGEIEISVESVGYRSAFIDAVLSTIPGAIDSTGPRDDPSATERDLTRYWAIRTDTANNTPYVWRELQAGRLRQGWGRRPEEDLHRISEMRRRGVPLDEWQRQTWRGNRRLVPTQPDAVRTGDLVVMPHLPRFGFWTIVRVVGPYRYSIDDGRNWAGKPDFGHILPVEIISEPIPWRDPAIPERLGPAMRLRPRMWNLDHLGSEVEQLARDFAAGRGSSVASRN